MTFRCVADVRQQAAACPREGWSVPIPGRLRYCGSGLMQIYRQMLVDLERIDPSWPSQCIEGQHTPSDLLWCGIVLERHTGPSGPAAYGILSVGWQSMIERARRDLVAIEGEWRVRHLAAACGPDEVRVFLEATR